MRSKGRQVFQAVRENSGPGDKISAMSKGTREKVQLVLVMSRAAGPTVQFIDFRRFPPPFVPEICQIPEVTCVPLRRDFSCSGSDSGSELQSGLRICAT